MLFRSLKHHNGTAWVHVKHGDYLNVQEVNVYLDREGLKRLLVDGQTALMALTEDVAVAR